MRSKGVLGALWLAAACAPTVSAPPAPLRWAAYYDQHLPAKAFADYDLLVFDRRYHPELAPFKGTTTVLAYISAGEIHGDRADEIASLEKEGALLKHQKNWGSHVVDITSPHWHRLVMADVADAKKQGFDGVMLDTFDSALHEAALLDDRKHAEAIEAALALIGQIRAKYPDFKIMLNRGFELLPEASGQLDFILAESIIAQTDVSTGQSTLTTPNSYRQVATVLESARAAAPQLKICVLDYWDKDDVDGIRFLYATHRKRGFSPYVTSLDLKTLLPEPHRQANLP